MNLLPISAKYFKSLVHSCNLQGSSTDLTEVQTIFFFSPLAKMTNLFVILVFWVYVTWKVKIIICKTTCSPKRLLFRQNATAIKCILEFLSCIQIVPLFPWYPQNVYWVSQTKTREPKMSFWLLVCQRLTQWSPLHQIIDKKDYFSFLFFCKDVFLKPFDEISRIKCNVCF